MTRYGMVIGLRAEKLEAERNLHAAVWPDVLRRIKQCHIQNYSIYEIPRHTPVASLLR